MLDQNDAIELELLKTRVKMLMKEPLFGQLILLLDFEDATAWCPTAATDGRKLYYNRNFIQSLTREQLVFLLCHEVRHILFDHVGRRGDRDPDIYNMAADFIVNYSLVREGIGDMPPNGLYDPDYTDEFSVEELYTLLMSKCVTVKATLDMHLDTTGTETSDTAPGTVTINPESLDDLQSDFLAALRRAASSEGVGDLPAGLHRLLNQLSAPRINWRQILNATLRSTLKYDYSYARPSRRSYAGLLLPGQSDEEKISVVAWLDGSASTTIEMVTAFLSECRGIMTSYRDFEIILGCFDTKTYNVQRFTPSNLYEINDYAFTGGGGTAPSCCWTYMHEEHIQPHKLLIFTDGLVGNDWGQEDFCDTVFIIHSNPVTAPYGLTCHFD
jgi:predicted metal-dependent peptidase